MLADVLPAFKVDSQLEGGLGRGHESLFLDVEQTQVSDQRRDRGLADAHRADLLRFDQGDVEHLAEGS